MKYPTIFLSFLLASCASLPPSGERNDPSQARHKHMQSANFFAGVTPFKPVPAGDWRALNRRVTPEEKK